MVDRDVEPEADFGFGELDPGSSRRDRRRDRKRAAGRGRRGVTWPTAALMAFAGFGGGMYVGVNPDTPIVGDLTEQVELRPTTIDDTEVRRLIERDFHKPVAGAKLRDASIRGMVGALDDRFSHYFDPSENKLFNEVVSGSYSGVGMAVNDNKRGLLVVETYAGSPARTAGIRAGDIVSAVNGRSIVGEPSDLAVARIKGPEGTAVTLTVSTRGAGKTGKKRELRVRRESIRIPVTDGKMKTYQGRRYGVVRLTSFVERAHESVANEVGRLESGGARGIIFDLRGNGGGRLDQAVEVAGLFIRRGLIVSTDGRSRRRVEFKAPGRAVAPDIPLVILVDRSTASASEIVAGAVQDRRRGKVVGVRTFGKGVFQEVTELKSGGAVSLTVGGYFLPSGRSIDHKGITPDVIARDRRATRRDEALAVALRELASADRGRGR